MPNRPLLRSRLVAALAKRTLLASSSASLRSSAVRSGARLNINGLVYHRRKVPGLTSSPGSAASSPTVSPGLVTVAARLHGAPPAGSAPGVVVVRPTAVLGGADLHPCPGPHGGGHHNVAENAAERPLHSALCAHKLGLGVPTQADYERQLFETHASRFSSLRPGVGGCRQTQDVSQLQRKLEILFPHRLIFSEEPTRGEPRP